MDLNKFNSDGSLNMKPVMLDQIKRARNKRRFDQARIILGHLKLIKRLEKQVQLVKQGLPYK